MLPWWRKDHQQENEEINVDGIGQVEEKNEIIPQECTYPSTSAGNAITKDDSRSFSKRDITEWWSLEMFLKKSWISVDNYEKQCMQEW